ncbi:uncharacterized protein AB675_8974 [Cyphellophora attinorum]|uniref:VOC domain-containing protein n=1 Tax=Cyphellophora attinorum TaxID=1664694 RepID=A0A0N1H4I1_9EURO|nr:uncharacterized protein AB675_8974 [Phialophora attinorum]KPI36192.1 hypothetical protein AB675_8974 [Phialophora attinorum]
MPSSITLTVSQLGQSTSFFLSALQPLGYIYRGQACSTTIAFGPRDTSIHPDFWLTQATASVPAGAAHVAFPAASRQAVQEFFSAAQRAGGTTLGAPCLRDSSGYYSAAVVDFDGNSIEAVHRPALDAGAAQLRTEICSVDVTPERSEGAQGSQVGSRQGDAFDIVLAQARSAADVARQLVSSVRPNLKSSPSAPATSTPSTQVHNKDAFAKAGDPSNAVVGTLFGVAAGAAMAYALTSRSSSSSPPNARSANDRHLHDDRPRIARSATIPSHLTRGRDSSRDHDHYIALQDNDSTTTAKPDQHRRRRGSFDSGLGPSPPSSTSTVQSSRRTKQRLIDAPPPPSAYRGPVTTSAAAVPPLPTRSSRSKTRDAADHHASNNSRSGVRSRSESRSKHQRHDSGYSENGYETVLHVTTRQSYGPSSAKDIQPQNFERGDVRSTSKTRSKASTTTARPPSEAAHPLPPSRAATWTADGGSISRARGRLDTTRKIGDDDADTFVSARTGISGLRTGHRGAGNGRDAQTVIGRMRDIQRLKVRAGEVRPEDSVSQVG